MQSIVYQNDDDDVALSLAKHVISAEARDKNFVFSPLSIHSVLGLTAAGSAGPARDELLDYFKAWSADDLHQLLTSQLTTLLRAEGGGPRVSFASGVWIDQSLTFKPAFEEIVERHYKAASHRVDFKYKAGEARKQVNKWVEKETKGLIKDLVPSSSLNHNTRLIFANALYFKGEWAEKFGIFSTQDREFFLLNGSSAEAPFMTDYGYKYVRAFNDFKVLRLPYKQGKDKRKFSMYLFLPDAIDGLPSLVKKVCSESGFITNHRPYEKVRVNKICVPKFKINFDFEASEVLKGQGIVSPFYGVYGGGLTEMVDSDEDDFVLCVSRIFHKSSIEMNEEGTEAAAATAESDDDMGCPLIKVIRPTLEFVADHPFMFVVREDVSGAVLFVGQVLAQSSC